MMQSISRLLVRGEFLYVAAGFKQPTKGLVLQARVRDPNGKVASHKIIDPETIRFGLTATRKIGNAVFRNRVKRRLRAIALEVLPQYGQPGTDYVLIGRFQTASRNFEDLREDLKYALRKLHKMQSES
jgi:ribonuclease P protein component